MSKEKVPLGAYQIVDLPMQFVHSENHVMNLKMYHKDV